MKILIVSQYFWPESFRINDLALGLAARGHEVTVLTGQPNYPAGDIYPDYKKAPEEFSRYQGIPVLRVPIWPRGQGFVSLAINYLSFALSGLVAGSWKLRNREFDLVFVYLVSPITAALPALWFGRWKKARVFVWVLDLWPESLAAVGAVRSGKILALVGKIVSFVYKRSDRILIQSRAFTDNVLQYNGKSEQIRYFPGWPELTIDAGYGAATAAEMAPYQSKFSILFAGNIGHAQDFPAILDAAEQLKKQNLNLIFVVLGDGRAADEVREDIRRRNLEAYVVLLGRFPLERMPGFFATADALLVSLKGDAIFGMTIPAKVQSYLEAGKPILGMLDGEGARVIAESGAGLTCPAGSSSGLAKIASDLMKLSAMERTAMGARGADYCRREFDREALIDRLDGWMTGKNDVNS